MCDKKKTMKSASEKSHDNLASAKGCLLTLAICIAIWAIISFLLFVCISDSHADDWTPTQKYMQAGVTALTVVDWLQTRAAAQEPDKYEETYGTVVWFIGEHPSPGMVDRYFVCSVVAKGLITHVLPSGWRAWWQGLCAGVSGTLVWHNNQVGIWMGRAF